MRMAQVLRFLRISVSVVIMEPKLPQAYARKRPIFKHVQAGGPSPNAVAVGTVRCCVGNRTEACVIFGL